MTHPNLRPLALLALFLLLALSGPSAHAAPVRYWPSSSWGDKDRPDGNGSIHTLQSLLCAQGYPVAVDGIFGGGTESALKKFQRAHHLVASGTANKPTWEALIITLRQGSRGPAVSAAQVRLRAAGYAVPTDGVFGAGMKTAVRKFQAQTDHTADGIIGPSTWAELVGVDEGSND